MIDIYPEIFNGLQSKLTEFENSYDGEILLDERTIRLIRSYIDASSKFPCIIIEEKNNISHNNELDNVESHSLIVYEFNIYDNSIKKMEVCSKLSMVVNSYMSEKLGFERTQNEPIPNVADATIYRIFQRYEGVIDNQTLRITRN